MPGLTLDRLVYDRMIAHCLEAYPYEGCGLVAGQPGSARATKCYPTGNAATSARVYEIDPREHLRADRDADDQGLEILGVFHSHTHTDAFPSPTDVEQAPVADWHYILVSFKEEPPVVRSYRIVNGNIEEEAVVVGS